MQKLTAYNGVQIVTPDPQDEGGLALNGNFKALSTHIDTQGPDGTLVPMRAFGPPGTWKTLGVAYPAWCTPSGTLFTFFGYDSRGNRTVMVDPKANSTPASTISLVGFTTSYDPPATSCMNGRYRARRVRRRRVAAAFTPTIRWTVC